MPHTPEAQLIAEERYIHHVMDIPKQIVREQPRYAELRGRGASHPQAFKQASEEYANDPSAEISEADRALLLVTARLGEYVTAQGEVNYIVDGAKLQNRALSPHERSVVKHLKTEYLIPFNQSLKEFVNTHPNDEINTVSSALANAHTTIFSRYDTINQTELIYGQRPDEIEVLKSTKSALNGMRHEIAAESLLSAAGLSFDHETSTEDDSRGVDLRVKIGSKM